MIERINELMRKEGLSELQFAKRIGVPQSSVNGYLSGKNTPPTKFLISVITEFSDVSAEWLLRGEGEMYISDIPKDGDTEEVIDLKVEITKLKLENERLLSKVEQMRRERDHAIKERDQLMLENRAINRRVDKLIDILYQDPATRSPFAADERVSYVADSTIAG